MSRVLLLSLLLVSPAAAQLFVDTNYAASSVVRDVLGADLDGDGDRDLISGSNLSTATSPPPGVQLWINDGSGGFTPGATLSGLVGVNGLSLLDANLDGHDDLLVVASGDAHFFLGGVAVLLGDGAGGFPTSISKFLSSAPTSHDVADVDGDGVLDVALTLPNTAQVALLHGLGNGAFGPPTLLVAGLKPAAVALPDLQLDGAPDLVVLNGAGATLTVRGGTGGGFAPPVSWATAAGATALMAANVDGDLFPDVVVAASGNDTVSVHRSDGAGGLLAPLTAPTLPQAFALGRGDVEIDGDLDVLVANAVVGAPAEITAAIALLHGDGTGALAAPEGVIAGGQALALDVGDLDGDLLPDLAVARYHDALELRTGNGLGGFFDVPFHATEPTPSAVLIASLGTDAAPDVALANIAPDQVSVYAGDGTTGLGAPAVLSIGANVNPTDLAAGDVTGDGRDDLISSNVFDDNVTVFAADGAGSWLAPVSYACGNEPRSLVTADVDGDGDADVLTCNTSNNTVALLRAAGGVLLPPVHAVVGSHPLAMARGHADAGGTWDVATCNEFSKDYTVLHGDGAGGWLSAVVVPGDGAVALDLALADVDGDGDDDLLSIVAGPTIVAVRKSDGAGGYGAAANFSVPTAPNSIIASDLDLDGALDAIVTHAGSSPSSGQISVLRGLGNGGFAAPELHALKTRSTSVAAGDLDVDGAPDLVVAMQQENRIAVLRNVSLGGPWTSLGSELSGDFAPKLAGAGSLFAGSPGSLTLFEAPPSAPAALFFAPTSTPTPFKGGTLVPAPPAITTLLVTPPSGLFKLPWAAFPPVSSGSTFYFQGAVADAGAPAGVALSGALKAVVP